MKRDKPSIYPYDKVEEDPELTGYLVGASKFGYAMKGFSRILSRNVMDQRHFPSMSQHWVYKLGAQPAISNVLGCVTCPTQSIVLGCVLCVDGQASLLRWD